MPAHTLGAEARKIVESARQSDRAGKIRRTGLKPPRGGEKTAALLRDLAHHLPAEESRRELFRKAGGEPEHADPRGTVDLMSGKTVKIAAELPHVHRQMSRRLRAVDQDGNAPRVRNLRQTRHRIHGAEDV